MPVYVGYGLGIQSALPLPDLIATTSEVPADVSLHIQPYGTITSLMPPTEYALGAFDGGIFLWWDDIGLFFVRGGSDIAFEPDAAVDARLLQGLIINEVMAALLHQRGKLVLHGSAAVIDDGVVVFIGKSGQGKSTTAGALQAYGHLAIADDVVAIDLDYRAGVAHVLPAFPQVKLWPEAVSALGHDVDALPRVTHDTEKRIYRQSDGFPQSPLPLRAIYVLDKGDKTRIQTLPPQHAHFELLTHSYMNHLSVNYEVDLLTESATLAAHFKRSAALASAIPIKRLTRRFALTELSELVKLIERDAVR